MAAQDTFHGEVGPIEDAPLLDGLDSVVGAGGAVTAFWSQQRRDGILVDFYGENQEIF